MGKTLEELGYKRRDFGYAHFQGHGNVIIFEPADKSIHVSSFPYSNETKLSIDELEAILAFAKEYFETV